MSFFLGFNSNSLFSQNNKTNNKEESLFAKSTLFNDNTNNQTSNEKNNLFMNVNNKPSIFESPLFGVKNQSPKEDTKQSSLFEFKSQSPKLGDANPSPLFGQNLLSKSNQNYFFKFNPFEKKEPRNNNISNEVKKKCKHDDNYIAFCTKDLKNEGGLVCYNCLYDYHKDHISQCIPIEFNSFEKYKKFYKDHINKYKNILKEKFNEIISILDKYENEEIEDISNLFEEKTDLNYELPIEIPFIERFEYAINKKIMSLLDNLLSKGILNYDLLNLYKNNLTTLKISQNNPNNNETITIKSLTDFKLYGIGIPKIIDNEEKLIEIKIYKGNSLLETINEFEDKDNLSLGIFGSGPLKINQNDEYTLEFKGINNLNYISYDEEYNKNSKIKINSTNAETILACLLIK